MTDKSPPDPLLTPLFRYVDELIRNVLNFLPDLADMISSLEEKVYMAKKAEEEEANSWAKSGSAQVLCGC